MWKIDLSCGRAGIGMFIWEQMMHGSWIFLILEAILAHQALKPIHMFFLQSCPYNAYVILHMLCETNKYMFHVQDGLCMTVKEMA